MDGRKDGVGRNPNRNRVETGDHETTVPYM